MFDGFIWLISWAFMLVGCVFVVSGAVGLIRMPDLYTRLHASSLTDTGGAIVISMGLLIQAIFVFGDAMAAIKVTLILFFTLFTSPTASHALAKTALLCGHVPTDSDGKPILESPEEATLLARSRSSDYQSGQDAEEALQQSKQQAREHQSVDDSGADSESGEGKR